LNRIIPDFLVVAPPYSKDVGGSMALHYLCHLLNEIGTAHIVPMPFGQLLSYANYNNFEHIKNSEMSRLQNYNLAGHLNTPIIKGHLDQKNLVIVYPEIVHGNPLNGENVARWLLYHSGFHRKEICLSKGEVQFQYQSFFTPTFIKDFVELSDIILQIIEMPKDVHKTLFNEVELSANVVQKGRQGVAYSVRKGLKVNHPLLDETAISIDGKPFDEVVAILRQCTHFVSFDPDTFFSKIACALGCYSIVEADLKPDDLEERKNNSGFISWDGHNIEETWNYRQQLLDKFDETERYNKSCVQAFFNFWEQRLNGSN